MLYVTFVSRTVRLMAQVRAWNNKGKQLWNVQHERVTPMCANIETIFNYLVSGLQLAIGRCNSDQHQVLPYPVMEVIPPL